MFFPTLLMIAQESGNHELFMPAPLFGVVMFLLLMTALLITLGFANKNRQLPPQNHADH